MWHTVTWQDPALETALNRCREAHTGVNPCLTREYLTARHEYHKLLVARGLLDPKLAEKRPD